MASIYDIKPKFQQLLRPCVIGLHKNHISPNAITILAFLGSAFVGIAMACLSNHSMWFLLLPIWLFMRMALNAMDGMLARDYQLQSPLGGILNELGDVLSDIFLYLPFAFISSSAQWPVVFFVIAAVLTELCGVLGKALGAERHYEGPMGKSDRAFMVGVLALVSAFWPPSVAYWAPVFWILFALCLLTCYQRLVGILKEVTRV